jgi:cytochrome oxidase Cu insertion factor (SCO1/SenC/PrrC family)
MDKKFFGFLSLAAVALAILWPHVSTSQFRGTGTEAISDAQELVKSDGQVFRLMTKGKIVLLLVTSCPDVCPTTLAELNS